MGAGSRRRRIPEWEQPDTRIEAHFRTRVAATLPNGVLVGRLDAEKYTARRDLTADGADFESLCGFDE